MARVLIFLIDKAVLEARAPRSAFEENAFVFLLNSLGLPSDHQHDVKVGLSSIKITS